MQFSCVKVASLKALYKRCFVFGLGENLALEIFQQS